MRIAIISDIHSNLAALTAVLERINSLAVDEIYCLGDIVGYGPHPNECTTLVRDKCRLAVKGNHDSGLIGETSLDDFNQHGQRAIRWTQEHITKENLKYLQALPLMHVQQDLTLVHSSPCEPEAWTYILTTRAAHEAFQTLGTDLCFVGHTHVPVVIGEDMSLNSFRSPQAGQGPRLRFIVNVGSVGQPRDGNPDAAFGLLDLTAWSYRLIRVPYDIQTTADAILAAGLPDALAKRLFQGI